MLDKSEDEEEFKKNEDPDSYQRPPKKKFYLD